MNFFLIQSGFLNPLLLLLLLGVFSFFLGKFIKHKSLYPFMPFKYDFRKRRNTYKRVLSLLEVTNSKILIETGTSREGLKGAKSNGAATIVYGKWAKINNAHLHSVDISEKSIRVAKQEVEKQNLSSNVTLHLNDSVEFLNKFEQKVDFLYLDSYDYTNDKAQQLLSQKHHLDEFKAIEDKLHKNTIVLIDDCDLEGGGKGKLVIEYMKEKDWLIEMEAYQVLLLHKNFSK